MTRREEKTVARGRHPDEITLQRFREGLSSARKRVQVSDHLAGCEACRAVVDSYEQLNNLLSRCAAVEVPANLVDELVAKVLPVSEEVVVSARGPVVTTRARLRGLGGAALALTLAGLVLLWPVLSGLDSLAVQVLGGFKAALVNLLYLGRIFDGLQVLLEPLRAPAMVFGAMVTAACAALASRRYARGLSY